MPVKVYNVLFLCTHNSSRSKNRGEFGKIYRQISTRISLFANMPLEKIEKAAIHLELKAIGNTPV